VAALRSNPAEGSQTGEAPYLTIVAASRNDDHGLGMTRRMQTFVNALIAQCDRHRLQAELLLVDWNPPPDRPPLAEALEWPPSEGYCRVRVVQVPAALHSRLDHSDRLPLFQMIAKNVGIRRAESPFVLATNVDLLFSDGLMRFLARRKLDPAKVYRVDRFDISEAIDPEWPVEQQLEYCRANVIRINRRNGSLDVRTGDFYAIYRGARWIAALPWVFGSAGSLAIAVYRRVYAAVYWFVAGFNDPRKVPGRIKRRLGRLARRLAGKPVPARETGRALGGGGSARERLGRLREDWIAEKARVRLHTNASGDFTLMSKQAWLRSGGYAELEMYSMHIDGLQLYQARYSGTSEKFLRYPIYHIEHQAGFKPEPDGARRLVQRLESAAIPQVSNEQLSAWILEMYLTQKPIEFNQSDWGFADEDLPEGTVHLDRAAPRRQS
jgi:hypothetical protein